MSKQAKRPLTQAEKRAKLISWGWLMISLAVALVVWFCLSIGEKTGRSFPFIPSVIDGMKTMIERDALWSDFCSSMISVAMGFGLGFVTALPVAFLMAWYTPVRKIIEPWINFIRNIPALAYAPLIVIMLGVGRAPSVVLIWICTFMTMCITIFHGIRNIDNTLVKAARVLGANDMDIFFRITLPATVPFILPPCGWDSARASPPCWRRSPPAPRPVWACVSAPFRPPLRPTPCWATSSSSASSAHC